MIHASSIGVRHHWLDLTYVRIYLRSGDIWRSQNSHGCHLTRAQLWDLDVVNGVAFFLEGLYSCLQVLLTDTQEVLGAFTEVKIAVLRYTGGNVLLCLS